MKVYEGNERTLPFILEDKAKTLGSKVFIYYKDETVTYDGLNEKANRMANTLTKEMGVLRGDKVAVMLPNCADYVIVPFGVAKASSSLEPLSLSVRLHKSSVCYSYAEWYSFRVTDYWAIDIVRTYRLPYIARKEVNRCKHTV